jgi:hypothetical protein
MHLILNVYRDRVVQINKLKSTVHENQLKVLTVNSILILV